MVLKPGVAFVEADVAEAALGGRIANVVVVDEGEVADPPGEELANGDFVCLPAAGLVWRADGTGVAVGATQLEDTAARGDEVVVEADGVDLSGPVTSELEGQDGVPCDDVRGAECLPAVALDVDGSALVLDGHSRRSVLRSAAVGPDGRRGEVERAREWGARDVRRETDLEGRVAGGGVGLDGDLEGRRRLDLDRDAGAPAATRLVGHHDLREVGSRLVIGVGGGLAGARGPVAEVPLEGQAGVPFVEADVAEAALGKRLGHVVVVDEDQVVHLAGVVCTDGDDIGLPAAPVGGGLVDGVGLGAVELEEEVARGMEVGVEADGVDVPLVVAAELEHQDRVGGYVVVEGDGLPAVAAQRHVAAGRLNLEGAVLGRAVGEERLVVEVDRLDGLDALDGCGESHAQGRRAARGLGPGGDRQGRELLDLDLDTRLGGARVGVGHRDRGHVSAWLLVEVGWRGDGGHLAVAEVPAEPLDLSTADLRVEMDGQGSEAAGRIGGGRDDERG